MDDRLLREGHEVTHEELTGELAGEEVLVATWFRGTFPFARLVPDKVHFLGIVANAENGTYNRLRWHASTPGLVSVCNYDMG